MSRAQSSASPTSTTVSGLPGTTGTPAAAMSRRAAVLSPIVRIASDDGPTNTRAARAGGAGPPAARDGGGAAGPVEPQLDQTVGADARERDDPVRGERGAAECRGRRLPRAAGDEAATHAGGVGPGERGAELAERRLEARRERPRRDPTLEADELPGFVRGVPRRRLRRGRRGQPLPRDPPRGGGPRLGPPPPAR